ncbi:signal recognition particle protein, partial [Candidatus Acetothermia bacterium]|nr:signal recognition particle protein [Candidatus Acetothermia bacterium]
MAERILGMGDILGLIEQAEAQLDHADAEDFVRKVREDKFSLEDFRTQIRQVRKLGPLTKLLQKIPGMGQVEVDEKALNRVEAILNSMTRHERLRPEVLNGSRKKRIASGSGVQVSDVNKLLKRFEEARKMMKQLKGKRLPMGMPFGR